MAFQKRREKCTDTANAIRYLVGRIEGKLVFMKGFIRFGTRDSGFIENYNAGGVLCYLDKNGFFNEGNVIDSKTKKNRIIHHHPDTGVELKGQIPCWDTIQFAVEQFGDQFPQLDYLGFDFVVTLDGRVIILEINSLTSLDALQLDGSILGTDAGSFFKNRM